MSDGNNATSRSRRDFLKKAGASIAVCGCVGTGASALARSVGGGEAPSGPRLAMVVDAAKCARKDGCTACMDACHLAHNVPDFSGTRHEIKWIWKDTHAHVFPNQVHDYTPQPEFGPVVAGDLFPIPIPGDKGILSYLLS